MPDKQKVLFIAGWYPSQSKPYLGNFVRNHALAAQDVCDLCLITVTGGEEAGIQESRDENFKIISSQFRSNKSKSNFSKILVYPRYIRACLKAISLYFQKNGKPDLIHLHVAFPAGWMALYLKFEYRIPFIVTEHWTGYHKENRTRLGSFARWLSARIFRNASLILPVSENLKENIVELFQPNCPIELLGNAVDTNVFNISEVERKPGPIRFLHVSTLFEEAKNVFGIFNAFKNLKDKGLQFELRIVHEYPSPEHVDYAQKMGLLNTNVKFLGGMNSIEIAKEMKNSDAFILFSNFENLPVVLIEAMASGLPIIATRVGDVPRLVDVERGILVDAGNEAQLVIAIEEMSNKFGFFDRAAIRKFAHEKYSMNSIADKLASFYKQVIVRKNAR